MNRAAVALALGLTLVTGACKSGRSPHKAAETATAKPLATAAPASRPLFVRGPTGGEPVAPFVANELRKGHESHYGVLVYVGATWCEPCQHFHHAVERGELDQLLANVHLLEFDLDQDRDALEKAGYTSQLIPLFALPKADGSASAQRIEGSIKGPSAVNQDLEPRLRAFLRGLAGN